jgi:hypothetical protein
MAAGPTGRVVGIDLADRLLDRARDKARQQNLSNVAFRHKRIWRTLATRMAVLGLEISKDWSREQESIT